MNNVFTEVLIEFAGHRGRNTIQAFLLSIFIYNNIFLPWATLKIGLAIHNPKIPLLNNG